MDDFWCCNQLKMHPIMKRVKRFNGILQNHFSIKNVEFIWVTKFSKRTIKSPFVCNYIIRHFNSIKLGPRGQTLWRFGRLKIRNFTNTKLTAADKTCVTVSTRLVLWFILCGRYLNFSRPFGGWWLHKTISAEERWFGFLSNATLWEWNCRVVTFDFPCVYQPTNYLLTNPHNQPPKHVETRVVKVNTGASINQLAGTAMEYLKVQVSSSPFGGLISRWTSDVSWKVVQCSAGSSVLYLANWIKPNGMTLTSKCSFLFHVDPWQRF